MPVITEAPSGTFDWKTATTAEAEAMLFSDPAALQRVWNDATVAYNTARHLYGSLDASGVMGGHEHPEMRREMNGFLSRMSRGTRAEQLLAAYEAREAMVKRGAEVQALFDTEEQKRRRIAHEARMAPQRERMREDRAIRLALPLRVPLDELRKGLDEAEGCLRRLETADDLVPVLIDIEAKLRAATAKVKALSHQQKAA